MQSSLLFLATFLDSLTATAQRALASSLLRQIRSCLLICIPYCQKKHASNFRTLATKSRTSLLLLEESLVVLVELLLILLGLL